MIQNVVNFMAGLIIGRAIERGESRSVPLLVVAWFLGSVGARLLDQGIGEWWRSTSSPSGRRG